MRLGAVLLGAGVFGASVAGGLQIGAAYKQLGAATAPGAEQQPAGDGGCAFDRLARVYDDIVGREETYMLIGLMRARLLRNATGDVLELAAGTGRNLPHYPLASLRSLTMTDVSGPMLAQARAKYFDQLQLQYKAPSLAVRFLLADAQRLLPPPGQAPVAAALPPSQQLQQAAAAEESGGQQRQPGAVGGGSSGSGTSSAGGSNGAGGSVWRLKRQAQSAASEQQSEPVGQPASSQQQQQQQQQQAHEQQRQQQARRSGAWFGWGAGAAPCACSSCRGGGPTGGPGPGPPAQLSSFAPGTFDTVVDTFGLCSCDDPVEALRQAAALLRPGGRLLLLEHGRASWAWLNEHMDRRAVRHHEQYGCWYNRDIEAIVQQAGLDVQSSWRWHFGTSYVITAGAGAAAAAAAAPAAPAPAGAAAAAAAPAGAAAASAASPRRKPLAAQA